jgi:hypothetical protein
MSSIFSSNQIGDESSLVIAYNQKPRQKGCALYHNMVTSKGFITISNILREYSKGNFTYLLQNLSNINYTTLSVELYKLKRYNRDYELIRRTLVFSLQGLLQCVYQTQELQSTLLAMPQYKDAYSTLHDNTLLAAYLDKLSKSFSGIFPEATITPTAATIKPEILEYIKLYGFPENAVFEADKLAQIIEELNKEDTDSDTNTDMEIDMNDWTNWTNWTEY